MTIRPYTPADKPGCLAAFESNMPRFFAPSELEDYAQWLDSLVARSAPETGIDNYFVAEENGSIIGCGGFYINRDKLEATMAWGLISQAYHKRGLGRQLFLYRINLIRQLCPQCTIILDTTQHSYPFFEKLGFSVTAITNNSYGEGLHRYDMVLKPSTEKTAEE